MSARQTSNAYAFIAFPLAVLFVFTLLPTIAGLGLSLFQWSGGQEWPAFIGLTNFRGLIADERFVASLRNTLIFVVASVPPTVLIAFALAVAIDADWFVGKSVTRTMVFMPTIVSIVAIGFVWRWLLDAEAGLLNWLLGLVGVTQTPAWLTDGWWPMAWIVIVSIWQKIGFCVVLYMAALGSVNRNLYEAAELDGASRLQVIWHITWNQVRPMTAFLMVTGVISALQVFDMVFMLTGQQETARTTVLNLEIYRQFTQGSYGYAAAIGVVIFVLTMIVTAVQLAWFGRRGARA